MSDDNLPNDDDNTPVTFTQEEVDKLINQRLGRERKKHEKELNQFAGVDMEKYQALLDAEEQAEKDKMHKQGEFDKLLKQTVEKKDAEIARLHKMVEQRERDGELLAAASRGNAVAPEQVADLLRSNVRINEEGKAEVIATDGSIRYNDNGDTLQVSDLVNEFLTTNPHFVKASQGGSGSNGSVGGDTQKPKAVEEMTHAEYAEYRRKIGRGNPQGLVQS